MFCLGKMAETISKYTQKGQLIGVEGRIQTNLYEDKVGDIKSYTQVQAHRVEFLEWIEQSDEKEKEKERDDREYYYGQELPF